MEKIKRFIECLVPVTVCNIKCSYCYIIQENRRTEKMPDFNYDAEHIGRALSKGRLGGTSYISICGAGETLIPKEMPDIIESILRQGHYVNITTNGTMTKRFNQIREIDSRLLKHLHFAFSFHYLELKRINKINEFFDNVQKMKEAGCSFLVQVNLCDEYLPYLEEIKKLCEEKVGAAPQIAATRNELTEEISLMTQHTRQEYKQFGKQFNSPLFEFTMKNFMVKRKEFCYAGDWSAILNLGTGELTKCYAEGKGQNIFEDISKPIKFSAVGSSCSSAYCINSSHFMSLGIIPGLDTPSYAGLRNRKEAKWYTAEMEEFLNGKLYENNEQYSTTRKLIVNVGNRNKKMVRRIKYKVYSLIKK